MTKKLRYVNIFDINGISYESSPFMAFHFFCESATLEIVHMKSPLLRKYRCHLLIRRNGDFGVNAVIFCYELTVSLTRFLNQKNMNYYV